MTTGERIREIRLRKGLTQEDLARKTGISTRTIQRIEQGAVHPRSFTLQAIADALDVEFEELAGSSNQPSELEAKDRAFWLPALHLSGMFLLLLPPLIIWMAKRDQIEGIRAHGVDVLNFQLSMLMIAIPCGTFAFLLVPIPILVFIGVFSTGVILLNALRVTNGQPYRYPLSIRFLSPTGT
ncbi:MAG: helix-turn-helix domain-containing protein [Bacteroidales bacterium]